MNILYRPITDAIEEPVVDFGDFWGRIDKNGEPTFKESKKENPLWLVAFVAKWMTISENLTEFGEDYFNTFYKEYFASLESNQGRWRKEFESDFINDLINEDKKSIANTTN